MRVVSQVLILVLLGACDSGSGGKEHLDTGIDWSWGSLDSGGPVDDLSSATDSVTPPGEDTTPSFPLVPGDPIPEFSLEAHSGAQVALSDYAGKTMVLSFFPTAAQGLSQQQIEKLEARYGEIRDLGGFPFGVSMEDPLTLSHWADELGLKSLLLLTDESGHVAAMFGAEHDGNHYLHRGDVVITPDGTVQAILLYDAKEPTDIQALLAVLGGPS